jgi:hypothetical protein
MNRSLVRWLKLDSWTLNYWTLSSLTNKLMNWTLESESEYESYVTTDGQSDSVSWNKAPTWGLRPDLYYCQTVARLLCGTLSLTRGQFCRLQLLLVLASAVFLGSESRGTRDHLLLSQIQDLSFNVILICWFQIRTRILCILLQFCALVLRKNSAFWPSYFYLIFLQFVNHYVKIKLYWRNKCLFLFQKCHYFKLRNGPTWYAHSCLTHVNEMIAIEVCALQLFNCHVRDQSSRINKQKYYLAHVMKAK